MCSEIGAGLISWGLIFLVYYGPSIFSADYFMSWPPGFWWWGNQGVSVESDRSVQVVAQLINPWLRSCSCLWISSIFICFFKCSFPSKFSYSHIAWFNILILLLQLPGSKSACKNKCNENSSVRWDDDNSWTACMVCCDFVIYQSEHINLLVAVT